MSLYQSVIKSVSHCELSSQHVLVKCAIEWSPHLHHQLLPLDWHPSPVLDPSHDVIAFVVAVIITRTAKVHTGRPQLIRRVL